jgi:hypothetical protein
VYYFRGEVFKEGLSKIITAEKVAGAWVWMDGVLNSQCISVVLPFREDTPAHKMTSQINATRHRLLILTLLVRRYLGTPSAKETGT